MNKIDSIEISVSPGRLYEAVAMFLGTLAYPDDEEMASRFHVAYCGETLRASAKIDRDLAWAPGARMAYFEMDPKTAKGVLEKGAGELRDRKAAVIATWGLFDEAVSGRKPARIEALGTVFQNTVEGRAILTNAWLKNEDTGTKNVGTRIINPSRRVIHAARAYWTVVIAARDMGRASNDDEAEAIIATEPAVFSAVLEITERCRRVAPSIKALRVSESDLVKFLVIPPRFQK